MSMRDWPILSTKKNFAQTKPNSSTAAPRVGEDAELIKVVARYRDGRLVKGFTRNFFANKDCFHVSPPDDPYGEPKAILMKELKAVFFVRDFAGNPRYVERKEFPIGQSLHGRRMEVRFSDGEVIVGATLGYGGDRIGFFIAPPDPNSNNIRVFAISTAVENVRRL